jgi:aspartyl-tRNA(Asn)/glutamyl-tRNA(Gln) amidotransferase subunit A
MMPECHDHVQKHVRDAAMLPTAVSRPGSRDIANFESNPMTAADLDLAFADIGHLGRALRTGERTSVELTRFFLDRLDRLGRRWNAVVALDLDDALEAAHAADAELVRGMDRGPLHGIPFAVKDILASRPPLPTSWGAAPFKDRQLPHDAVALARLRAAGGVLLGKLAMIELAGMAGFERFDAALTGACGNPFDPTRWTGDSSTGSAAAVGGGLVPFALASETHGSIIQPAAFCGTVGLRPSLGLVPLAGTMPIAPTVDRLGPIARTPLDCLTVLGAMSGCTWPTGDNARPRIAVLAPDPTLTDAEVTRCFEVAVATLSRFADLTPVELPHWPFAEVYRAIVLNEARLSFRRMIAEGVLQKLASPLAARADHLTAPFEERAYSDALELRAELILRWEAWSAPFDAIVAITNPRVAPPLDQTFSDYFGAHDHEPITTVGAALGLPAVTVPTGLAADGMPIGAQFVGRHGDDGLLCVVADALLARLGPLRPRPELVT